MKKEEIYVVIDSEEKRLRAIQILTDARENIGDTNFDEKYKYLWFDTTKEWNTFSFIWGAETEISLDQLEQMLNPQFVVKEIALPFEELQKQAKLHGWKLVKEERKIKVGDFGKFWDNDDIFQNQYGFLSEIESSNCFVSVVSDGNLEWLNFRHLTDEEKQQIQENW